MSSSIRCFTTFAIFFMDNTNLRLMIAAPRKSSGKTTLALGISKALTDRGLVVRMFKKGADYIDPMWHRAATGRACYSLDLHMMGAEACRRSFEKHSHRMGLSLVEGNHGLHDGLGIRGEESSAHLAKELNIPVLLVADAVGSNRGIAAVVLGHQQLDSDVRISGVVLNQVGNSRQESKQRSSIEYHCGIPVVGALPRSTAYHIKERHLGLLTIHETTLIETIISSAAHAVTQNCDLEKIKAVATRAVVYEPGSTEKSDAKTKVTIGVAYDRSFCFYYPENLDLLRAAGARLVFFDTLCDKTLPDVDGFYIGGGFPESFLQELEDNTVVRKQLKERIELGVPVYAECGGLMYLTRSIEFNGRRKEMVGALQADVRFQKKPVGHGYIHLKPQKGKSWLTSDSFITGHEFHYSKLTNISQDLTYHYKVKKGVGIDKIHDGLIYKNVLASYVHLHAIATPNWATEFVTFILRTRDRNQL